MAPSRAMGARVLEEAMATCSRTTTRRSLSPATRQTMYLRRNIRTAASSMHFGPENKRTPWTCSRNLQAWTPTLTSHITSRPISTATEAVSPAREAPASTLLDPLGAPKVAGSSTSSPSTSTILPSSHAASAPTKPSRPYPTIVGRVTKSQLTAQTVQVTRNLPKWSPYLKKHYRFDDRYLVHDPNGLLREGDVVEFHHFADDEYRARIAAGKGAHVKHVVKRVLSPFGTAVKERGRAGEGEGSEVSETTTMEERMRRLALKAEKRAEWEAGVAEQREKAVVVKTKGRGNRKARVKRAGN